jgi:hypothetical protein
MDIYKILFSGRLCKRDYRLNYDAGTIFNCFVELIEKAELNSEIEIPMQYVILTINICLKTYGADAIAFIE